MKRLILSLFILISSIAPVVAEPTSDDHRYILDIVESLKLIVLKQSNEKAAQTTLNRIKGSKPLFKNDRFQGQQIIHSGELNGFIGVKYNNNKASVAVYSTTPLKVRYATRRYKAFRSLLQKRYNELRYNHFDLGDQVIARIKKQARKITVDVYRK